MPISANYVTPSPLVPVLINNNGASTLVNQGFVNAQSYANDAIGKANNFLTELQSISQQLVSIPTVSVTVGNVEQTITPFSLPTIPARPVIALNVPEVPILSNTIAVPALNLPDAPVFIDQAPSINLNIAVPAELNASLQEAPILETFAIPNAPTIIIPDLPVLNALNLPNAPTIVIPSFNDTLEDLQAAPNVSFNFIEPTYESSLLVGLKAFLTEWTNGTFTGIKPEVEQAIWDRGRAREDVNAIRSTADIRIQYAGRGFTAPLGAMNNAIANAWQEALNKDSSLSRDVMIKQSELEQENRRFAVTTGVQLEGQLLTYSNQVAQRAFEAANTIVQSTIQIYQAIVSAYGAKAQAFQVKAQVFQTRLQAELSQLEIFKAQIEAQKLVGEINTQLLQAYSARIEALKANVDIYKATIEATNTRATINKTLVDSFVGQVQAYAEKVKAKTAEYDGYATRIKAEVSKVDVFRAQAEAYNSRVGAYSALTAAQVAQQNALIKVNQELPLQIFNSKIEAFGKIIAAESERVQALSSIYQADANVYQSNVGAQASRAGAESQVFTAQVQRVIGEAGVKVELAKANIQNINQSVSILSETIRAGAQVSAQLAASALSSVNLSGSISSNEGNSTSSSYSNSNSYGSSFSIGINQSASESTSKSTSESKSTSQVTTTNN